MHEGYSIDDSRQGDHIMNELEFSVYTCGMSEETFSEKIMIYKPVSCITKCFTEAELNQCRIISVSELIDHLKNDAGIKDALGTWGLENIGISTVYIQDNEWLLGLRQDKPISEIFRELETNRLKFAYFMAGGASIHNNTGYRFTVHPDEDIHRHMPHVHVSKAGINIRYSLDTLLPIDKLVNPHKRDNKKIIIPFLHGHCQQLIEMWNRYTEGYTTPVLDEKGRQYYSES